MKLYHFKGDEQDGAIGTCIGTWDPMESSVTFIFINDTSFLKYVISNDRTIPLMGPFEFAESLNSSQPPNLQFDYQTGEKLIT